MQTWKQVLEENKILQLPVAHDALTAKLIEQAGFPAYQVGGFANIGANFALPDIDLVQFGELAYFFKHIVGQHTVPVLVDCDNGYGDSKMVARTVRGYEDLGANALFIEDQASPKKCGHMQQKKLVSSEQMVHKLKVALSVLRSKDTFLLARTDAYESEGLAGAIRRADAYLQAGAHGVYLEGLSLTSDIAEAGRAFRDVPLAISILENGGKTLWFAPRFLQDMGYNMILYPATLLFRVTKTIQLGLQELRKNNQLCNNGVNMSEFEKIVDLDKWNSLD